jgi:prepilin-type N-terminal cleavage/methylation domain-containing protein
MSLRDQRGFTLIELLVSMAAGVIVTSTVVMITTVALHNQDRIARRVDANQRARPVMTRMIQELHSACVAPRIVPILAGSTGTSISFLSKPGSTVSPTPDKHVIAFSGTTLSESLFTATGGSAPGPWTFSGTASPNSPGPLLTNVTAPSGVMFRYFQFVNGALSTTPATTPLSATDAAKTAVVSISFVSSPSNAVKPVSNFDPNSPISFTDSADLRLEAAGQYPNQDNLPCV